MPPQMPSDQFYPEQARSNVTGIGAAQPLPFDRQGPAPEPPRRPTSRRSVLRGVAGVGAVAVAAGAGAAVAYERRSGQTTLMPVSKPVEMAPMAPNAMAGPLVVYVADTTTGLFDVYGNGGQTRVKNPALVKQILANLKLA